MGSSSYFHFTKEEKETKHNKKNLLKSLCSRWQLTCDVTGIFNFCLVVADRREQKLFFFHALPPLLYIYM